MNNKPNLPDELDLIGGKGGYSWRTDWKVNGWLYAAVILSAASDVFFPHQIGEWPMALRTMVVLAPFLALLLWMRSFARWVRGMDELHRRITLAACFFATAATLFVVTAWHRLDQEGVFQALFRMELKPQGSWDIGGVWLILGLMTGFYILGGKIFNRRYQ